MTDLEYPPQTRLRVRVTLKDIRGRVIQKKRMDIWQGEPIGDWVEFRGIRIALKRDRQFFEGIVPDSTE